MSALSLNFLPIFGFFIFYVYLTIPFLIRFNANSSLDAIIC